MLRVWHRCKMQMEAAQAWSPCSSQFKPHMLMPECQKWLNSEPGLLTHVSSPVSFYSWGNWGPKTGRDSPEDRISRMRNPTNKPLDPQKARLWLESPKLLKPMDAINDLIFSLTVASRSGFCCHLERTHGWRAELVRVPAICFHFSPFQLLFRSYSFIITSLPTSSPTSNHQSGPWGLVPPHTLYS